MRGYTLRGTARHSVAVVIEHVAFEFNHSAADILSPSRRRRLRWARYATAWLARRHTDATFAAIGVAMAGRDHSTVVHQVARANELRGSDAFFRFLTDHLDSLLVAA